MICFYKIGEREDRFFLEGGGVGVAQIMYTHVNNYKNDKIKNTK
jgi:hypothetical protein